MWIKDIFFVNKKNLGKKPKWPFKENIQFFNHEKNIYYHIVIDDTVLKFKLTKYRDFLKARNTLINIKQFPQQTGLLLINCKGYHTFFNKIDCDIILLNSSLKILSLYINVEKNKIIPYEKDGYYCIIVNKNTLSNIDINTSSVVKLIRKSSFL